MPKNKVRYGLKNAHYAKITLGSDGTATFGTPVAMPGAVSLSLTPNGEPEPQWADDINYFTMDNNMGYDGDLEIAMIPQEFLTDILHEEEDANGVLVERSDVETEHFALLFEFSGDKRCVRHVLYNCTAARPAMEGKTKSDKKEMQTEKLSISATPLPNRLVKAKTGDSTSDSAYNNWYNSVYVPDTQTDVAELSALSIGDLTLTPSFDADTTAYTATTSNASDTVTVTGADEDTIAVLTVNGSQHTSGEAATWQTGTNIVRAVAIKGEATRTYTVSVTKEE